MTQCTESSFEFEAHAGRQVVARFDGGAVTSDAGALLLREAERRIGLLDRVAACFEDWRDGRYVRHSLSEMLAQRVYGLALGYEDVNDHERLREDALFGLLAGRREAGRAPLAGKSTLNRLERGAGQADRYCKIHCRQERFDALLVELFLEAHAQAPERVVLDVDVTDLPLHGRQEGRFFHGFYDEYCYLPLYIFAGGHLLCARLRAAGEDAAAGVKEELERIVHQIRRRWPRVQIIVRGDSGFCREELMGWCEAQGVDYVLGLARNDRLRRRIEAGMEQARRQQRETGRAARVFAEFEHETVTGSWSRKRRVVAKAEMLEGKENPRFVVTSLSGQQWPARELYEDLYCERGEMENRIKEQLSLFAGRVSAETMRANQLRLNLAACAYVLVEALRRLGLKGTEMERAQAATIRLRLLKIGARIRMTARRIWVSMAEGFALMGVFRQAWAQLRC
jgi:hypothetical protein